MSCSSVFLCLYSIFLIGGAFVWWESVTDKKAKKEQAREKKRREEEERRLADLAKSERLAKERRRRVEDAQAAAADRKHQFLRKLTSMHELIELGQLEPAFELLPEFEAEFPEEKSAIIRLRLRALSARRQKTLHDLTEKQVLLDQLRHDFRGRTIGRNRS